MTRRDTLSRAATVSALLTMAALSSACASFNTSSIDQAERMEAAMQRQQAEPEKPATDNKLVYLDMIKTMQSRSLYFASLAHIDAYQKLHGSSPEIQRLRADALRATGQDAAAETQYRELMGTNEAAAAWHGLGLLAAQHHDYTCAITSLREAVRLDPINATILSDLGYALLQQDDLAGARLPLIQAAELAPENRKVISNLALYLMRAGEREKAEALMAKADLPPESRQEIMRRAGTAPSASANATAPRKLAAVSEQSGMQLQLQWQLLAPQDKSRRTE